MNYLMTSSLFTQPSCIIAWRTEIKRIASRVNEHQKLKNIDCALSLLQELYCRNNPNQKNPRETRIQIFNYFLQESTCGFPLAMFFEGLARKEGFGCSQDIKSGQALIQVAALRNCSEALNYLALCYVKQNIKIAYDLLKIAATQGHMQATCNLQTLLENIRILVKRKQKMLEFAASKRMQLVR